MDLDELRSVQNKERQKDSLQHLRDSFYEDVGAYVANLKTERDRVVDRVESPFSSPEVQALSDEIETAEEVAEAVYERRMGKLVKSASLAAADMPTDQDGMTTEERELFDDLVAQIQENKAQVLDTLAGASPDSSDTGASPDSADTGASEDDGPEAAGGTANANPAPPETPEGSDADREAPPPPDPLGDGDAVGAADLMGGHGEVADEDRSTPVEPRGDGGTETVPEATAVGGTPRSDATGATTVDRATLRIVEDVGSIFGVDEREYHLSAEDVVTLPQQNAEALVEKDAAERLD